MQAIFFHKRLDRNSFDPKLLAYAKQIKQPITVGEYTSASALNLEYEPDFKSSVQFMQAEFDFPICGGDCKGTYDANVLKEILSACEEF